MRPRGLPRGCPSARRVRTARAAGFNEAAGITPRMRSPAALETADTAALQ